MAAPKLVVAPPPAPEAPVDAGPIESVAPAAPSAIERYQHGWRSGKPVEDPDKLKRWGYVGAKPSEYLVCTRRGEVDRKRSGQGLRVFKWPWNAIAIVPTTLQRVEFTADQITREHIGVAVTGIAVYRIVDPLLAFRVLNFTFPEAASEKLAATLREMFVGAARRLIANLSLEDCLTRRKESIAGYLMQEIAPVVGGEGSPDDTTTKGWGVVIDTIEIQQVKIQSAQVFAHLQAPYRAAIAGRAELAELDRHRQVAERRAEAERLGLQAQLEATRATRTLKAKTEAEATEVEAREATRRSEMQAAAARRAAELERDRAVFLIEAAEQQRRTKAHAEVASLDAERERLEATRAVDDAKQLAELDRAQRAADHARALRRAEIDLREHEAALDAGHQRRLADIERELAQARALRELVTIALPQIAGALAQRVETLHYTQIGGDSERGPLGAVPVAFAQVLALAEQFGLQLPAKKS